MSSSPYESGDREYRGCCPLDGRPFAITRERSALLLFSFSKAAVILSTSRLRPLLCRLPYKVYLCDLEDDCATGAS